MVHGSPRTHRHWRSAIAGFLFCVGLTAAHIPSDLHATMREEWPLGDVPLTVVSTPVDGELLRDVPHRLRRNADAKPQTVWMTVTAYCGCKKCCGSHATGVTASGKPITYNDGRFCAADIRLLPYGTHISIPGYNDGKPVEVIDRGGAIKGYHLDVFMPTHQEAVDWGRKRIAVTIED